MIQEEYKDRLHTADRRIRFHLLGDLNCSIFLHSIYGDVGPSFDYNKLGFRVEGPLWRNRCWIQCQIYFFDYQGHKNESTRWLNHRLAHENLATVPGLSELCFSLNQGRWCHILDQLVFTNPVESELWKICISTFPELFWISCP